MAVIVATVELLSPPKLLNGPGRGHAADREEQETAQTSTNDAYAHGHASQDNVVAGRVI